MSKVTWTTGRVGMALGAASAVAVAVVGLYIADRLPFSPSPPTREAVEAAAPPPEATTQNAEAATPADRPQAEPDLAAGSQEAVASPIVPSVTPDPTADRQSAAAPDIAPPRFDLVRADPDGETLVAGAAAPLSDVEILLDGQVAGRAVADGSGRFVGFLSLAPSATARVLSLRATSSGDTWLSEGEVILAPSAPPPPGPKTEAVAVAADQTSDAPSAGSGTAEPSPRAVASAGDTPDPASGPARNADPEAAPPEVTATTPTRTQTAPASTSAPPTGVQTTEVEPGDLPETAPAAPEVAAAPAVPDVASTAAPAPDTGQADLPDGAPEIDLSRKAASDIRPAPPGTAGAPAVLLSNADGIEVLQAPGSPGPPQAATDLALDAITYSDLGAVVLTGRGAGADSLRIYLNNRVVGSARIRPDGRWRATLPDVASGTYTLRVDRLSDAGAVTARVESPFRREEPAVLAAATAEARNAPITALTVQPGNTLWAIARDRYGEGTAYVRVFEANRDSIRDPDLIYPGQVFTLPGD